MKFLITGGLGFIGSHFVIQTVNRGFDVINLDNETYASNRVNVKEIENKKNYKFIKGDICDNNLVRDIFKKERFDYVVNFAAESHVDRSIENPDIFINTNILGTNVLLKNSISYGIKRFIQISTDEVYGDLQIGEEKFTENNDLKPNSPYSASKASSDLLVRSYNKTFGLNTVITRCSNNFGPHQDSSKLIPVIVKKALNNENIPIYGKGENIRDWIFVLDHVEGIYLALEKGETGGIYNFGGNKELSNIDICKMILKILGKPESLISFVNDRKGHDFRYAINDKKSQNELGWKRKGNFEENLEKTVEYIKKSIIL